MINLTAGQINQIIVYTDTISNDVVSYGDFFLFGFQDTYTKEYFYVIPNYTTRNTRFINFQIDVDTACVDNPEDGNIFLALPGNWGYELYNMPFPSLDPLDGDLIDEGQAYLNPYNPPEVSFIEYISDNENLESEVYQYDQTIEYISYESDNENLRSMVYYSNQFLCCLIDQFNSPYVVSSFEISKCDPLFVTDLGFLDITDTGELFINAA